MFRVIVLELRDHAPFTIFGALAGIILMLLLFYLPLPRDLLVTSFWVLHPTHVVLSALVTGGIYRLYSGQHFWKVLLIGYVGSIGVASLSDCMVPYLAEILLDLPNRKVHLGFIEKWWLVNPLALMGTIVAFFRPSTKFPHSGHVLLSTCGSLFHMAMALGHSINLLTVLVMPFFLFLAVWLPCCTSDIVFPLLFSGKNLSGKTGSPLLETTKPK